MMFMIATVTLMVKDPGINKLHTAVRNGKRCCARIIDRHQGHDAHSLPDARAPLLASLPPLLFHLHNLRYQACIYWVRRRTSAVTDVHLGTLTRTTTLENRRSQEETLEEPRTLSVGIGQRGRRNGVIRPVDGPLPVLVVWLDTDNKTPLTPPVESITLDISTSGSSG